MKVLLVLSACLLAIGQAFAADGTFQGKVIDPPANQKSDPGWIFVQGQNRTLRYVEVAHAEVVFGESVPPEHRKKCNSDCLVAGQQVRITAALDRSGLWRAKRVEILELPLAGNVVAGMAPLNRSLLSTTSCGLLSLLDNQLR